MEDLGAVANLRTIKYQSVEQDIVNTSDTVNISFETDRLYSKVKGLAIQIVPLTGTINTDFLKFKKAEIQGREIYPVDFFAKHLETSNDVPFNKKFDREIDEPAKSSKIDIILKDDYTKVTTLPMPGTYKVIITLLLQN
jgi:hypothetical protein